MELQKRRKLDTEGESQIMEVDLDEGHSKFTKPEGPIEEHFVYICQKPSAKEVISEQEQNAEINSMVSGGQVGPGGAQLKMQPSNMHPQQSSHNN